MKHRLASICAALCFLTACAAPDADNEIRITPSLLGCDIAELDSLVLYTGKQRILDTTPCSNAQIFHTSNGDPSPLDSLEAWIEGLQFVSGALAAYADGSVYWTRYQRSSLLETYLQKRAPEQRWPNFLLTAATWPGEGWAWLPPPLDSITGPPVLFQEILQRKRFNKPAWPTGFPWSLDSLDTLIALNIAQGRLPRLPYLRHASRQVSQRYVDSLFYEIYEMDSTTWIPLPDCDDLGSRFWLRTPLSAQQCKKSSAQSLTYAEASKCARQYGGRLPTYAEWRCALFGGDSLPWPLPGPLPDGVSVTGAENLLADCNVWLADTVNTIPRRFSTIPARASPVWESSSEPSSAGETTTLSKACVHVVRSASDDTL